VTLKYYINNKTTHNSVILYGAIILNILLGWGIAKLNTHYLSLQEYGQYSFFLVIIYYTQSFFTLGTFESTSRLLALTDDDQKKRQFYGATIISTILLMVPFTLFLFSFSFFSDLLFEVKVSFLYRQNLLFAGLVLLQGFFSAALRGSGDIRFLSLFTFSPRFFYLLILAGIIIFGNYTLQGSVFALFAGVFVALLLIIVIVKPVFTKMKNRIKDIITEIKQYGIHIFLGNIMHETLVHADKLIISYFLPSEAMGYYGLAYMLTFPLSHFSNSVATTLFNKFASQQKIDKKVIHINFLYIYVSVTIFILLREPIIRYLFSPTYLPTVEPLLPLAIAFGFSGLSKPYTLFLMAKGEGKIVRNISIIIPIVSVILNFILVQIYGINGAAWSAFAAYGLDFLLYYYSYHKSLSNILVNKND